LNDDGEIDTKPRVPHSASKDLSVCNDASVSVSKSASLSTSHTPAEADIEGCITTCLQRLYIVRCIDLTQLVITLHSLEAVLTCKTDVRLLLIDSLSAIFPPSFSTRPYSCESRSVSSLKPVSDILHRLASMFGLVVVTTSSVQRMKSQRRNRRTYAQSRSTDAHSHGVKIKKICEASSYVSLGSFWQLPSLRLLFSRHCCVEDMEDKSVQHPSSMDVLCCVCCVTPRDISHRHFSVQSHGLSFISS